MGKWKKVRIGEFLTERQGRYKPDDNAIATYKRLDKIDFSGTAHISEKPSKSDMIVVQPGDLVISGISVAKGAIAVYQGTEPVTATIHYSSYIFDDSVVDLEYFKYFVKSPTFIETLKKQAKGGIKTEIKPKVFLPLEISLPDLPTQKQIVKRISVNLKRVNKLAKEIETQKGYAKQLRRNILQDAIEGKLTADWRKEHPVQKGNPDYDAEALFELIQTERKVDKKRKALPPLLDAEKPFELSTGWKWVRLGEISESCLGKMLDGIKNQGMPRKYLRNLNVRWFDFDLSDLLEMKIRDEELSRYSVKKGDLLIFEGGYPGRSAIWNESYSICFQKAIHRVHFFSMADMSIIFNYYLFYLCETNQIERYLTGEGIKHLTGVKLKQMIITLAPSQEQAEIVSRMKKLLLEVEQLEKEITQREEYTNQLMRSILQEAFEEKCGLILHF